jgi:hypothetical protein
MTNIMCENRPRLELTGKDGNAFNILGLAKKAAEEAGWQRARIEVFIREATSKDYNHLLETCMEYFDVY